MNLVHRLGAPPAGTEVGPAPSTVVRRASRGAGVVVGYDGSASARRALRWAASFAARQGWSIEVVTSWEGTGSGGGQGGVGRARAENAADEAMSSCPATELGTLVVQGEPGPSLVAVSQGADLLVVGTAGPVGAWGSLAGRVSRHCLRHARCPVVVLGPEVVSDVVDRVVVSTALDPTGSVLPWAVDQARALAVGVHLVRAGDPRPVTPVPPARPAGVGAQGALERLRDQAHGRLVALAGDDVPWTQDVASGPVREALGRSLRPTDLLVLPTAGLESLAWSVGRCAVAVLPASWTAAAPGSDGPGPVSPTRG